jgi:hypothetical protein
MKICFIESAFPAFLCKYLEADLFVYSKVSVKFSHLGQKKIVLPVSAMRFAKILASVCRFYCYFQGGFGIAFRISKSKAVVSDGILTEYLIRSEQIQVREFISIDYIKKEIDVNQTKEIILGNNFYEFGNMSYETYKNYLLALRAAYPEAMYFPHPKEEERQLLLDIFKDKLVTWSGNVESYCRKYGIPGRLIGFVGSTAMASLGKLAKQSFEIHGICIPKEFCDGKLRDNTDPYLLKRRSIEMTLERLANTVKSVLKDELNVKIIERNLLS